MCPPLNGSTRRHVYQLLNHTYTAFIRDLYCVYTRFILDLYSIYTGFILHLSYPPRARKLPPRVTCPRNQPDFIRLRQCAHCPRNACVMCAGSYPGFHEIGFFRTEMCGVCFYEQFTRKSCNSTTNFFDVNGSFCG